MREVNQVPRRIEFSQRHAHVHISQPRDEPTRMWGASWTGDDGTARKILRLELRELLDELEKIFDQDPRQE